MVRSNILLLVSLLLSAGSMFADTADSSSSGTGLSVIAVPYLSSSPETGLLLGVAGILSLQLDAQDVLNRRASTISAGANLSELGQYMVATNFDLYFNDLRSRINGRIGYEKTPTRYYGIGPYSRQEDEVWFDPTYMKVQSSYFHRAIETDDGQGFTIGGRLEYWNTSNALYKDEPLPEDFVKPHGWDGGLSLGLGLVMTYDTRDNAYFPTKNIYVEARSMTYGRVFGADFEYTRSWLDVRGYYGIPVLGETVVIAGQTLFDVTLGNAPFYDLPSYGGDQQMRGVLRYRWIDKASLAGQVEVRSRIWWKLGLAAFIGVGDVYPSEGKMSLAHMRVAYGAGLRVYLDREAGLIGRIDVGKSDWGTAAYLTFGEAF